MAYNLIVTDRADELIEDKTVYVVGLFHDLEDYPSKVVEYIMVAGSK